VDQLVLLEIECPPICVGRNDDALHAPKLPTKVVALRRGEWLANLVLLFEKTRCRGTFLGCM
jgi:hypothetical protein